MYKYLCENCMHKEYEIEEAEEAPFPMFSIVGGIFGVATTILTGIILAVPVALIVGMGTDLIRCESCGSDENVYETMSSEEDDEGRTFSPLNPIGGESDVNSFWEKESESTPKTRYRYNEEEGKLMPVENQSSLLRQESRKSNFDWSIPSESADLKSPDITEQAIQKNISSVNDENINLYEDNKISSVPSVTGEDLNGRSKDLKPGLHPEPGDLNERHEGIINKPSSDGDE